MAKDVTEQVGLGRHLQARFSRGQPVRIEVRHVGTSGDNAIVDSWIPESWKGRSPAELADEIFERLKEDAKPFKGMQSYAVLCFASEREESASRKIIRVEGRLILDDPSESEPPTDKGVVSQSMRHLEARERIILRQTESAFANLSAENANLRKQISEAFEQQLKGFALVQDLMDRREERAIKIEVERNSENFRTSIFKKVDLMLPMMGAKLLPESGLEKLQIAAFFESLTEPQVNQIIRILKPDQTTILIRIVMTRGQDPKKIAEFIGGLDDNQFQGVMAALSPEQMGVLADYWGTMQKKAEKEATEAEQKEHEKQNGVS